MKRFHVHVHVTDLEKNIAFYSAMFEQQPARTEADYAKWMLSDPPVNFAISTRGNAPGVDHLGIQVDKPEELAALKARASRADMTLLDEGPTTCCYARSDKYWLTDPQGIAWEQFYTLDNIPVFSEVRPASAEASACCAAAPGSPSSPAAAKVAIPLTPGAARRMGAVLRDPHTLGILVLGAVAALGFMGVRSLPLMAQLQNQNQPLPALADTRDASSPLAAASAGAPAACC
jgi:catechol 2,3-dioxygenase-like lactoylglutathione lyase family enzyme